MPKEAEIESAVSVPRSGGGWTQKGRATPFKVLEGSLKQDPLAQAAEFKCTDHAEMRALRLVEKASMVNVKLTQNAFPCECCHPALLKMSRGTAQITVVVTANKGQYNLHHKISGLTVSDEELPLTIVYQAGHASYNGTRDDHQAY